MSNAHRTRPIKTLLAALAIGSILVVAAGCGGGNSSDYSMDEIEHRIEAKWNAGANRVDGQTVAKVDCSETGSEEIDAKCLADYAWDGTKLTAMVDVTYTTDGGFIWEES